MMSWQQMSVGEFGVTSRANESDRFVGKLVNEQPIPTQMAFAAVLHVSGELVVPFDVGVV